MATNNPFPGMNPFLEPRWQGIHGSLIVYARDQMQPLLPAGLRARSEERLIVDADEPPVTRSVHPDVYVAEYPRAAQSGGGAATAVVEEASVFSEPLLIRIENEPLHQRYVVIREPGRDGRIVTIIEFVSPTNKRPGDGRDLYHQKRQECVEAGVNVVEIDLIRQGKRELLVGDYLPPTARTDYAVCVHRAIRPLEYEVYPVSLRSALPTVRVPLRPDDPDLPLSLQPLIDRVMTTGGYDDLDYTAALDPPLTEQDAQWLAERLENLARQASAGDS